MTTKIPPSVLRVRKVAATHVITIPNAIIRATGWEAGDPVVVTLTTGPTSNARRTPIVTIREDPTCRKSKHSPSRRAKRR